MEDVIVVFIITNQNIANLDILYPITMNIISPVVIAREIQIIAIGLQ